MIGIIGAMDKEVEELKASMDAVSVFEKAGMEFYNGILEGKGVVVVRSGVGKVNAAACTQLLIDKYDPDVIVNTGIAGSLDAKINIGDIVLSTDALEHDMDVTGLGYKKGIIPDQDVSIFIADEKTRKIAKESCEKVNTDISVFEGRVVSGDQFISGREKKDMIKEEFDGLCTEMEGASIAHVSYLNKVPFLIIRAISDKADDSANEDYPSFQKKAIRHSVALVKEMIKNM